MPKYTFSEVVTFFGEKIGSSPPKEDLKDGSVELMFDNRSVSLKKGNREGSMVIEILLGVVAQPLLEEHLKELAMSNYLGMNTAGCTLAYKLPGSLLSLKMATTPGTSPQECWEWMHRVLCVAQEWGEALALWEEVIPLIKEGE